MLPYCPVKCADGVYVRFWEGCSKRARTPMYELYRTNNGVSQATLSG